MTTNPKFPAGQPPLPPPPGGYAAPPPQPQPQPQLTEAPDSARQLVQNAAAIAAMREPDPIVCTDPDLYYPGQSAPSTGMTVLLFGPIGTWKTTFAAMWPSPVFLSCGSEGGDDSLGQVGSIWPGLKTPPTYRINSRDKMVDKVEFIMRNAKQYGWKTVVIDSLTFYVDTWIKDLIEMRYKVIAQKGRKLGAKDQFQLAMEIQDWGALEHHIMKELVPRLHNSGLNVIWTALTKEGRDGQGNASSIKPDVAGAAERKLPGVCKLVLYAMQEHVMMEQQDPTTGQMRTMPKMIPKYYVKPPSPLVQQVRHRYGPNAFPYGYLVDPQFGVIPTFNAVDSQIGNYIKK